MKFNILHIIVSCMLTFCSVNVNAQKTTTDATICNAIRNYLLGRSGAAILTATAKQDLVESTWPEVQCSVDGTLDSPRSFKNLTVKRVAPGKFKYSCICPTHGDKYTDCCTMSAILGKDGKVRITHVKWDNNANMSLSDAIASSRWSTTEYGFRMPDCFTPSSDIYVDDVPASFQRWTYDDVCVACWPMLGNWAVTDYPDAGHYLTESTLIKNVTYHNAAYTIFSGNTNDGRIWYMKEKILSGGQVDHAKVLVLIYQKSKQSDVKALIDVVKGW